MVKPDTTSKARSKFRHYLAYLGLSGMLIVVDQITKQLAERLLEPHAPVHVLPSFNLTLMYNKGAAFSFLNDAGGWQRWFFIVFGIAVSIVLLVWLWRLGREERWLAAALSCIIGGAVGNIIDRVAFGHVIDFIVLYYDRFYWPTFNVADSAITVGAAILIIQSLFENKSKPKRS